MTLEMFEESNEGVQLPHPPLSLRIHLVVESAIRAAWRLMVTRGRPDFDLATATEDVVTHELYERLYDEIFDKGVVDGFNREVFASVRREPKVRNFNGNSPDKMPDLLVEFIDRPAGVMNSQYGLFIECKPVDKAHTVGAHYCDRGLIRFVNGDYAWAMQNGMMVAYARPDYALLEKLSVALEDRKDTISTSYGPVYCLSSNPADYAERVAVSKHERTFSYIETNSPAGVIVIRHLWLRRG
ncbi:MAG: hypothetical protein NT105_22605 [Verrucomicrobia bacterium]|nr:hypothetical protein [Verrucomicrobiota bacterium]